MKQFQPKNKNGAPSGFLIPENYFDDISNRTMTKLAHSKKPTVLSIHLHPSFYKVAAIILLSLSIPSISYFYNKQISNKEIEQYLISTNLDNMQIAEFLELGTVKNMRSNMNLDQSAIEDILASNGNLETYIIN